MWALKLGEENAVVFMYFYSVRLQLITSMQLRSPIFKNSLQLV